MTSGAALGGAALNHRWQESTTQTEREDRLREARSALRRDAYTRYLIASERLSDYFMSQPPPEDPIDTTDPEKLLERLRTLWTDADDLATEYLSALMQMRLLADAQVSAALEEFNSWLEQRIADLLRQSNPLQGGLATTVDERRKPLVEAMRAELRADLLADAA